MSAIAIALFVAVIGCNANGLPSPFLIPLRVVTLGSSAIAGTLGLIVFLTIAQRRERTKDAIVTGSLACVAALPAFAVFVKLLFPGD